MATLKVPKIRTESRPRIGDSNRDLFLKLKSQLEKLEERLVLMDAGGDYLMTRQEVAKLFRVEPVTVTRWLKEGRLPGVLTDEEGTRVKYRHSDVMEFMKNLKPMYGTGGYKLKREAVK